MTRYAAVTARIVLFLLASCAPARAQTLAARELQPLAFLLGTWTATGSGQPGSGAGDATFEPALQGHVLIRKSFAEYPATASAPASRHDDLMVFYVGDRGTLRADYYDNEGHTIRYAVALGGPGQVSLVSDATSNAPRYRLTYKLDGATLAGRFEIAPPGQPDAFAQYLVWQSRKTHPPE